MIIKYIQFKGKTFPKNIVWGGDNFYFSEFLFETTVIKYSQVTLI